jgi:hypothetical protein
LINTYSFCIYRHMQQPKFWTVVLIFIVLQMDFKTILCSVTVITGITNLSKLHI